MNFVRPILIPSPSGAMAAPRITESRRGDKIYVEAAWYDPNNGTFFHRGIVEIKDVEPPANA